MPAFSGFDGLANHFERILANLPTARREALDSVGAVVKAAAIAKLGSYQPAAGPFAEWQELSPYTLANAKRQALTGGADSPLLVTGKHIRDTIQTLTVGTENHTGSDDPIAFYQERGTNRIPPRSFLGSALFEQSKACVAIVTLRYERLFTTGV